MKLFIVRHGQTDANKNNVIQGLDSKLNAIGKSQVQHLAKYLQEVDIDIAYSSDAARCKETTAIINTSLQLQKVIFTPYLREKDNGDWKGISVKDIDWTTVEQAGSFANATPPNGESLKQVRERAHKFKNELLSTKNQNVQNILIISHGGWIKTFVGDLLGLDLQESIFHLQIDNASLSIVEVGDNLRGKALLSLWNYTPYSSNS